MPRLEAPQINNMQSKIGINGFNRTAKILLRILVEKVASLILVND